MEAVGGPRHLGARRRLQLRQGPTGTGGCREPRLPDRAVPRRTDPQHPGRGSALMTAHRAGPRRARPGRVDGRRLRGDRPSPDQRQPALGQQHADHERGDARHRRHRGGVRADVRRRLRRVGVRQRRLARRRSTRWWRPRTQPHGLPTRRATRTTWSRAVPPVLGRRAGRDRHPRLRLLRAGPGRGVRTRPRRRADPLRVREPPGDHDVRRLLDRTAAASRAADRPLRRARARRRISRAARGSVARPATSWTWTRSRSRRSSLGGSAGRSARSTCRPAATTRSCRRPRSPT